MPQHPSAHGFPAPLADPVIVLTKALQAQLEGSLMETLYVRNLNEKLGVTRLKAAVLETFSEHGTVLTVVVRKTLKLKGQAFVVFDEPAQAQSALSALNGQDFHGKPLDISFAKTKSDVIVKRADGDSAVEQRVRSRKEGKVRSGLKRPADTYSNLPSAKRAKAPGQPHNILFIEGLPASASLEKLTSIYQSASGFVEARLFAARGVGFVEFLNVEDATAALKITADIDGTTALVSFAKQ